MILLITISVTLLAAVFGVCVDITAIPGIARDNHDLAAAIATYIALFLFNVCLAAIVAGWWWFWRQP